MATTKRSLITAAALTSALLAASPFALAHQHGDGEHGKRDMAQMCEQYKAGTGKFSPEAKEARQAKMEQWRAKADARHDEMAKRLKLSDEQRQIWDQMQAEQRQKRQERMAAWKAKMAERCDAPAQ